MKRRSVPDRTSPTSGGPTIIDGHFHVWGEPFPQRPFPWTPDPFPASDLLALLDQHGVTGGVDVTPIMYGWDNRYAITAAADAGGRVSVFGRFDPFAPQARERLTRWMATPGAAGVRLTFYGADLARLDDPNTLDPFWAAAAGLGVPVAVFAPDRLWEIVRAVELHPTLRLIVDHLGLGVYPGCEDPFLGYPALKELVPFEQVLVKISGAVEVSRTTFPFVDMQELVAEAHARFGANRLLWGSNYPVVLDACTYAEALAFVDECDCFDDADRAAVLSGTCASLLATAPATT